MSSYRARILAIDDTPANLLMLGAALESDYEIQFATSGQEGLALALRSPPDLILLDVMMPELDGFETFSRLSKQTTLRDIPVIFVTALDQAESEVAALRLGAADYITKPVKVTIARQRIHNLLEREQLRKEVLSQRDQLRKLSVAVEQSPAAVAIANLDACLEYVNRHFSEITGYSAAEAIGQNPRMLQSGLTHRSTYVDMWDKLTRGQIWKGELLNKRKNGEVYWQESQIAPIKDAHGAVTHYVAMFSDISDRKAMEDEVRQLGFHDSLTRLPNRRLLDDRLTLTMAGSKRSGSYCALMFIDLDNFKPLNDLHGHATGDLLLMEVARRLSTCVREVDTVARFGGDEFVVMLGELDTDRPLAIEQALVVAEKVRASLAARYELPMAAGSPAVQHQCSASIGVVIFGNDEVAHADVMRYADAAMYRAKEAGRNSIHLFELPK